jgi:hypothetical protein
MEYSPPATSKFDRVYREPETSKEVSPQVSRSNPRGNQRPFPREFPGLHVDPALPSTLQDNLRLTKTDRLIQLSARGFYRANAQGEQPLTERTLVATLIAMHEHITVVENDARRERAARVLAVERFTKFISLLGLNHTLLRVFPWLSTLRVNLAVFYSCFSYFRFVKYLDMIALQITDR